MDEHADQVCLGLSLGTGSGEYQARRQDVGSANKRRERFLDLAISNYPSGDELKHETESKKSSLSSCSTVKGDVTKSSRNRCKKRLMLAKDQANFLERTFERNQTLNMAQKLALAEELDMKPRQIEVWFQNRRARSKLKQTEMDCKFLQLNCQRLREENLRLEKELMELQGLIYHQVPKVVAIKTCSSCGKTDII